MNALEFVRKWLGNTNTERQSYQQFFLDLCALADHPTPRELDPDATFFTFEAGVQRSDGGQGWADVWYKGHFAIEFKRPDADLNRAYDQLLRYREALENPPLLVVSDTQRIIVRTNFTATATQTHTLTLQDLTTAEGMRIVRALFHNPGSLRPDKTTAQVTEDAAREFGKLADQMRRWQTPDDQIAHYLIRLLFILFAEDVDLIPRGLFTRLVEVGRRNPGRFNLHMRDLFAAMASGGVFGEHELLHFNGGLFNDAPVLAMDLQEIEILQRVAGLDWGSIEPSILGTLFVRSLDPAKRAQLGAHYTSEQDILLIVEPVLMQPLRREWEAVQARAHTLAAERATAQNRSQRARKQTELEQLLSGFDMRLAQVRVLDPACGSGNFLYVALRLLLDLEKELIHFCGEMFVQPFFPTVTPVQLFGIELNEYAHELAQATVWIGYLQWLHVNGYGIPSEPILKELDNIRQMDAILAWDAAGNPTEPAWPEADVIVGNPPFLGVFKLRSELGNKYVEDLLRLYRRKLPASDLVCYWFERARQSLVNGDVDRVGLLATQAIRGGANRTVLERIKDTGEIFFAWSDRLWIQGDAVVQVSMIGFDRGDERTRELNGKPVFSIAPDLSFGPDVTLAQVLKENANLTYKGVEKAGNFDIPDSLAKLMISTPPKTGEKYNAEVLRRIINASDLLGRNEQRWIIDFFGISLEDAMLYELPYQYILQSVKPFRDQNRRNQRREKWWLFGETRPAMRKAVAGLRRYIVTGRVAKHRIFAFFESNSLPDDALIVIPREDDYFLGVLQASPHEVWARQTGTQLRDADSGFRYTPTTTFETYPFPWAPGTEPVDDARVVEIAAAAADLVQQRDGWLNPPDLPDAELKKRTLTNLYNLRPEWLAALHTRLDRAVHAAYGWEYPLADEEILARLLALNLARSA